MLDIAPAKFDIGSTFRRKNHGQGYIQPRHRTAWKRDRTDRFAGPWRVSYRQAPAHLPSSAADDPDRPRRCLAGEADRLLRRSDRANLLLHRARPHASVTDELVSNGGKADREAARVQAGDLSRICERDFNFQDVASGGCLASTGGSAAGQSQSPQARPLHEWLQGAAPTHRAMAPRNARPARLRRTRIGAAGIGYFKTPSPPRMWGR